MVADAGDGALGELRDGLDQRQESYTVGLLGEEMALTAPSRWVPHVPTGRRGRPTTRAYLAEDGPRPVAIHALAETLERPMVRWREGTKGTLEGQFAWVRIWPVHRWQTSVPAEAIPDAEEAARWLLDRHARLHLPRPSRARRDVQAHPRRAAVDDRAHEHGAGLGAGALSPLAGPVVRTVRPSRYDAISPADD